ncbi:hypothetical protein M9H77_17735 [Catharanthus roseus]|uniref:Uncharacterized protein n=1 Tax=Catharanthus roseus TaxID=4058 RepID=A0ACC0B5N4_CATRO|nr:hypothetical protein M9H77_17735 [Catharanthus roseus]
MDNPKLEVGIIFSDSFKNKSANSGWISRNYIREIGHGKKIDVMGLKAAIKRKFKVGISTAQVYRAREKAIESIQGERQQQYWRLFDYCETLKAKNPETVANLVVDRGQPILSMLVSIRRQLMNRLQEKSRSILKSNKQKIIDFEAVKAGNGAWEVTEFEKAYVWDMTAVPCVHACTAIVHDGQEPTSFCHPCYNVETYKSAYQHIIVPNPEQMHWLKTTNEEEVPPPIKRPPGRPKKQRRKSLDEQQPNQSRVYLKGSQGHFTLWPCRPNKRKRTRGQDDFVRTTTAAVVTTPNVPQEVGNNILNKETRKGRGRNTSEGRRENERERGNYSSGRNCKERRNFTSVRNGRGRRYGGGKKRITMVHYVGLGIRMN